MKYFALIALCAATLAGQTMPPTTAVTGSVIDEATGTPLARVNISLAPADGDRIAGRTPQPGAGTATASATLTRDDGAFRLDGVKPGRYIVRARRPGYFPSNGTPVEVRGTVAPEPVRVGLRPQTILSGIVVDENGDPVEDVTVQLVQTRQGRGGQWGSVGSAAVDDRGTFRMVTAAAGEFYLLAHPIRPQPSTSTPGAILAPTFYPSSATPASAEKLFLKPGAELADIKIKLRSSKAFKMSGRAIDGSGSPVKQATVQVMAADLPPGGSFLTTTTREPDGMFEVENVIPGRYRVMALTQGSSGRASSWAIHEVAVTDADVTGVDIAILPPVTVSGTVDIPLPPIPAGGPTDIVPVEGIETRPKVRIGLNPAVWDGMSRSYSVEAREDGSFTIEGVQPGAYEVATGFQYGAYLASVELNGKDTLGKPLEIKSKIDGLHLTYKTDGGTLRATLQGERPPASEPPLIAIIPVDAELRRPPFLLVFQMTMGRQVTIPRLRPGDYTVWIFDRFGGYEQLASADFIKRIEATGRRVKIEPDGDLQVDVPLTHWP